MGTPIFDENSSYQQVDGNLASFKTTRGIFEKELHAYTITHAIEDKNVLSFHIDYYGKSDGKGGQTKPKKNELPPPEAVIKAILDKHDSATNQRRFNAVLATASINHAIEYFEQFKPLQAQKQSEDENFEPLNIACVFSPPAQIAKENDGNSNGSVNGNKNAADIKQLQEDLPQESADNQVEPEKKKGCTDGNYCLLQCAIRHQSHH